MQILSAADRHLLISPNGKSLRISYNQPIKGTMLSSATAKTQEKNMLYFLLNISSTLFRSVPVAITVMLLYYATWPGPTSSTVRLIVGLWSSRHLSRIIEKRSSCDMLVTQIDLGRCCT